MMSAPRTLSPAEVVERELSALPRGRNADALSHYRAVYAMTRQQGLGRNPQRIPPTRQFAHEQAIEEARRVDPTFTVPVPRIVRR